MTEITACRKPAKGENLVIMSDNVEEPLGEEPNPPVSSVQPAAADTTTVPCCAQMDERSATTCTLCTKTRICKNCRGSVNGKSVCTACKDQILAELEAEKAGGMHLPLAVIVGS